MKHSRTERLLNGVGLSYLSQALTLLTGLWLTPFLLRWIGPHQYGLWLVGMQYTLYLTLTDLGVVGLLPRTIAQATGRAGGAVDAHDLPEIIGQAARLVLWQTGAVGILGLILFWTTPASWGALQWPLALILAAYTTLYPLRILPAVLQGLQDLSYIGIASIAAYLIGSAVTIALAFAGCGLYALAAGWIASQALASIMYWFRLAAKFKYVAPERIPSLSWRVARENLKNGGWISVAQIAQLLLNGVDILIIGKVLGPMAVVPYACTGKLIAVLANQPQTIMQQALPALSELRAGESPKHLLRIMSALSLAMLTASGAVACLALVINQGFVRWWIGAEQYGGESLTALLVLAMLLRHWNTAWIYTLFCFGRERRIAWTNLIDGFITALSSFLLVKWIGAKGAALGSVLGVCLASLPSNLIALSRELQSPPQRLLKALWPWGWRFVFAAASLWLWAKAWPLDSILKIFVGAVIASLVYAAVMLPMAMNSPLGLYIQPHYSRCRGAMSRILRSATS